MKTFKDFVTMNEKASFKVGDKVKEVVPMGQFIPGETLEIVQIKSGRIGVIAKGQNPKDALFDDPKNFKLVNEEYTNEAGYVVTVSVRDARKANEFAEDSYRGLYKNDGSDVFVFKKESDKEDFESELLDMGLEVLDEEVELDEAKMYVSEYLSDSDVSYILQAVGVSWRDFEKRVKDAIQQYLKMLLGDVQKVTVTRANIGGYMFAHGGSVRLLVNEILYEFREDGESHQSVIKKQEIWVNL